MDVDEYIPKNTYSNYAGECTVYSLNFPLQSVLKDMSCPGRYCSQNHWIYSGLRRQSGKMAEIWALELLTRLRKQGINTLEDPTKLNVRHITT